MNYKKEFKPYYVQRVVKMRDAAKNPTGNLTGYYKSGIKLADEERNNLRDIIPLDYMGSAEFEFGAVYKALNRMANKELFELSFLVKGKPNGFLIPTHELSKLESVDATVHALCSSDQAGALVSYFELMANGDQYQHKERTEIREGLFGLVNDKRSSKGPVYVREESDVSGWIDIDLDWFACKDKLQFNRIKTMLGK